MENKAVKFITCALLNKNKHRFVQKNSHNTIFTIFDELQIKNEIIAMWLFLRQNREM